MENSSSLFSTLQPAIQQALQVLDRNIPAFAHLYPAETTTNNIYLPMKSGGRYPDGSNVSWTTSFLPGMLWLAYELTADEKYCRAGAQHIASFADRIAQKIDVDTHDLGFLYTLSCVIPWRLTGSETARQAALHAADHLMTRYFEKAGIIQAWGNLDDPQQRGRVIIDSLMNMPLLYWASDQTGDPRFRQAAQTHAARLRDHIFRPDNSTYHTYHFDPETGAALRGSTAQGFGDESCWARGQAWGIYGFAINYSYTRDESLLQAAQRCADYFLANLPADRVAYWDLMFNDGSHEERDSSSAAIAVCGLFELARWLPAGVERARCQAAAEEILTSLIQSYANRDSRASNALLLHGVYGKPAGAGVDEANMWGDYFYLEALTRVAKPDWQSYW